MPPLLGSLVRLPQRAIRHHARAMATLAGGPGASPRVAVVGGGLSGLFCATTLSQFGYQVSLFDMGKAAPGERALRGDGGGERRGRMLRGGERCV